MNTSTRVRSSSVLLFGDKRDGKRVFGKLIVFVYLTVSFVACLIEYSRVAGLQSILNIMFCYIFYIIKLSFLYVIEPPSFLLQTVRMRGNLERRNEYESQEEYPIKKTNRMQNTAVVCCLRMRHVEYAIRLNTFFK